MDCIRGLSRASTPPLTLGTDHRLTPASLCWSSSPPAPPGVHSRGAVCPGPQTGQAHLIPTPASFSCTTLPWDPQMSHGHPAATMRSGRLKIGNRPPSTLCLEEMNGGGGSPSAPGYLGTPTPRVQWVHGGQCRCRVYCCLGPGREMHRPTQSVKSPLPRGFLKQLASRAKNSTQLLSHPMAPQGEIILQQRPEKGGC